LIFKLKKITTTGAFACRQIRTEEKSCLAGKIIVVDETVFLQEVSTLDRIWISIAVLVI
jgi:hypothetical protein